MSDQSVCRVCLDGNVAMYCISNSTELRELYESLASIQLDGTPETLCYICYSELKRYWRFAKLCKQSRKILSALANNGYELTNKTVDTLHYGNGMKKKYSIKVLKPTLLPLLPTKHFMEVPIKIESVEVEENFEEKVDRLENSKQFSLEEINTEQDVESRDNYSRKSHLDLCSKLNIIETDFDELTGKSENHFDEKITSVEENMTDYEDLSEEIDIQVDGRDMAREKEISIAGQDIHTRNTKTRHTQNHATKKTNYVCSNCSETFTNKKKMIIHLRTHTVKTDKHVDLSCNECSKTFTKRVQFTRHMKQHVVGRIHACQICNKAFYVKVNLDRHMQIHTGVKPYACDMCGKTFNQKVHLKNHLKSQSKKLFKCSKSFEKPICDYCNKIIKNKITLGNHIKIRHTKEKSHVCTICARRFIQKCNLAKHMISHKEKVTTHICHICGKIFSKRRLLTIHLKIHNPVHLSSKCKNKFPTKSTKEKHYCKICDKTFSHKCNLAVHLRTHTGEKPFTCHDCGKRFGQKICLIKHSRVHTGIKPFACDQCDRKFTQKNSLTHHLKTHRAKF